MFTEKGRRSGKNNVNQEALKKFEFKKTTLNNKNIFFSFLHWKGSVSVGSTGATFLW